MAGMPEKLQYSSPTNERLGKISEIKKKNTSIRKTKSASDSEKIDLVRQVVQRVLKPHGERVNFGSAFETRNAEHKPKSTRDKYNEATIQEICGIVNDKTKELFYCNCNCNRENEDIAMKTMKKKHKQCTILLEELYNIVEIIADNVLKDPTAFISVKVGESTLEYPMRVDGEPPIIIIGPHGTEVPEARYAKIRWNTAQGATRMLCALVFDRATILLTDFSDSILDPFKIADIEHCVKKKTKGSTEEIHKAIAKKCHDTHVKFMKYKLSDLKL